jgi:hypothetical protein
MIIIAKLIGKSLKSLQKNKLSLIMLSKYISRTLFSEYIKDKQCNFFRDLFFIKIKVFSSKKLSLNLFLKEKVYEN